MQIFIMEDRNICVGEFVDDGMTIGLDNAFVIRRWGTTKGLGEIAYGGPTNKTILDPCPPIRTHVLKVLFRMECNAEAWAKASLPERPK